MSNEWSKKVFANNLRHYMELTGKTQKELAAVAGVTEASFSEYANAKKFPRIDKIQKLADYFGILKSDLIEDKGIDKKEVDELTMLLNKLSEEQKQSLIRYALFLLSQEQ